MKIQEIRLFKEPDKSFIFYHEKTPFSPWHHHPEYELVLIIKGKGKRMVGDHIDRFEDNDLVFIGANTPHEWLCDKEYYKDTGEFSGEGIVIQFTYDFLGEKFFEIHENKVLKKFLLGSSRGFEIYGQCKKQIIPLMHKMLKMNDTNQLYTLFSIFKILLSTKEFHIMSSPIFQEPSWLDGYEPMQKALQFIIQNFQKQIQIKDLLRVTNMSNTTFFNAFKYSYRMPFKTYLMSVRIGYACRLLIDATQNISEIAYDSGFENRSNFNRQFKKIKGVTPSQYQKQNRFTYR